MQKDRSKMKNIKVKYFVISVLSIFTIIFVWFICINVLQLKSETVFPGPLKVLNTFLINYM